MDVLVSYRPHLLADSNFRVACVTQAVSSEGQTNLYQLNLNTLLILFTIWKGFLKFVPGICGFAVRLMSILREGKLT